MKVDYRNHSYDYCNRAYAIHFEMGRLNIYGRKKSEEIKPCGFDRAIA